MTESKRVLRLDEKKRKPKKETVEAQKAKSGYTTVEFLAVPPPGENLIDMQKQIVKDAIQKTIGQLITQQSGTQSGKTATQQAHEELAHEQAQLNAQEIKLAAGDDWEVVVPTGCQIEDRWEEQSLISWQPIEAMSNPPALQTYRCLRFSVYNALDGYRLFRACREAKPIKVQTHLGTMQVVVLHLEMSITDDHQYHVGPTYSVECRVVS